MLFYHTVNTLRNAKEFSFSLSFAYIIIDWSKGKSLFGENNRGIIKRTNNMLLEAALLLFAFLKSFLSPIF